MLLIMYLHIYLSTNKYSYLVWMITKSVWLKMHLIGFVGFFQCNTCMYMHTYTTHTLHYYSWTGGSSELTIYYYVFINKYFEWYTYSNQTASIQPFYDFKYAYAVVQINLSEKLKNIFQELLDISVPVYSNCAGLSIASTQTAVAAVFSKNIPIWNYW